eukprot:scaffold10872_cov129-Isochrysis_galbana.AAC.5
MRGLRHSRLTTTTRRPATLGRARPSCMAASMLLARVGQSTIHVAAWNRAAVHDRMTSEND